jgi:DNA primase
VAIGGSNISDEQVGMILGLNVDIVIALDKDQSKENIKEICKKFSKYRNTYFIWDKWGLLGCKDSPADANNKTYNFLMKYKIKYNE